MELSTCSATTEEEKLQNEKIEEGKALFNNRQALVGLFNEFKFPGHLHEGKGNGIHLGLQGDVANKVDNILSYLNSLKKDSQNSIDVDVKKASIYIFEKLAKLDILITFLFQLCNLDDNKDPNLKALVVYLTNALLNCFRFIEICFEPMEEIKIKLIEEIDQYSNDHDFIGFLKTKRYEFVALASHVNRIKNEMGNFSLPLFKQYFEDQNSLPNGNSITNVDLIPILILFFNELNYYYSKDFNYKCSEDLKNCDLCKHTGRFMYLAYSIIYLQQMFQPNVLVEAVELMDINN